MTVVIVALVACVAVPHAGASDYWSATGTLTWDATETQLVAADHGTNAWADTRTKLEWTVSLASKTSPWVYEYTFWGPERDLSNIIIETSVGFGQEATQSCRSE